MRRSPRAIRQGCYNQCMNPYFSNTNGRDSSSSLDDMRPETGKRHMADEK